MLQILRHCIKNIATILRRLARRTNADAMTGDTVEGQATLFDRGAVESFRSELQEAFGHVPFEYPAQCLNVAYNLVEEVEAIFVEHFPEMGRIKPLIVIGNVVLPDQPVPWCNEKKARSFAQNPLANSKVRDDYHAWISFGELVVDLTLLHSNDGDHGLERDQVIVCEGLISENCGGRIEFQPYGEFSKSDLNRLR